MKRLINFRPSETNYVARPNISGKYGFGPAAAFCKRTPLKIIFYHLHVLRSYPIKIEAYCRYRSAQVRHARGGELPRGVK